MSKKLVERVDVRQYGETWIDTGGRFHPRLHTCPVCGYQFDPEYQRDKEIHYWFDHKPEDFGLSPLKQQ